MADFDRKNAVKRGGWAVEVHVAHVKTELYRNRLAELFCIVLDEKNKKGKPIDADSTSHKTNSEIISLIRGKTVKWCAITVYFFILLNKM